MDDEKKVYVLKLYGALSVLAGSGLLVEHIYRWGFEPLDILGHEWLGLLLIAVGSFLGWRALETWKKSLISK